MTRGEVSALYVDSVCHQRSQLWQQQFDLKSLHWNTTGQRAMCNPFWNSPALPREQPGTVYGGGGDSQPVRSQTYVYAVSEYFLRDRPTAMGLYAETQIAPKLC
jgi:hypothetical protein